MDEYISCHPPKTGQLLKALRNVVLKAAPDAEEKIGYGMPAYKFHGMLLYFAAFRNHIGFYPMASAIKSFEEKLCRFRTSKGTIQFPLDRPLPVKLISEIVRFRVSENLEKASIKNSHAGRLPFNLPEPAKRALANNKITTLRILSGFTEAEILKLHGVGPSSILILRRALKTANLSFRKK